MAGHSKWANIKHRKQAVDNKRGKIFHRLVKELTIAAKLGGSDVAANSRLRIAIANARSANMPNDTIERAVKKGAGELEGVTYEEVRYEVYAAGGVGLIVDALTDKKSRTTPEIKSILNKYNASLADAGAVTRLFEQKGDIVIARDVVSEETLLEVVIDAGADDIQVEDEYYEVFTTPENFSGVSELVREQGWETQVAEVRFIPIVGTEVVVSAEDQAATLLKLVEILEDHDDVQAVHHNADIPEDVMESLSAQ